MTLTKREKILLQVMVCLGAFSLILVFLVLPQMEKRVSLSVSTQQLEQEYQEKEALLSNEELDTQYDTELAKAKENYNYFYSVLNSYSIDEIINSLIQQYELSVYSLNIGDYEDASYDFTRLEEEKLKILVKSTVNLTVSGEYSKILAFIAALNEKSPCLSVDTVSMAQNTDSASGTESMTASFRIYIYGINVKLETLDITQ